LEQLYPGTIVARQLGGKGEEAVAEPKLTQAQKQLAREMKAKKKSYQQIMLVCNMTQSQVSRVVNQQSLTESKREYRKRGNMPAYKWFEIHGHKGVR